MTMANDCESENYVAGMWRIFMPCTPVPALRNIILAATYAQRCCIQHLWAHARRGFVEVLKSLGLNPKKLPGESAREGAPRTGCAAAHPNALRH